MIGQFLTVNHPDLVENMILCSTSAKIEKDNKVFINWKKASIMRDIIRLNTLFLNSVYSDSFRESIKDSIPSFLQQENSEDCQRFTILIDSMLGFNFTDQLEKIKCPALVICDKKDKVFNYTDGTEIAEKIGCNVIVYDKYNHAVYDEAPDLKEKIADFLR